METGRSRSPGGSVLLYYYEHLKLCIIVNIKYMPYLVLEYIDLSAVYLVSCEAQLQNVFVLLELLSLTHVHLIRTPSENLSIDNHNITHSLQAQENSTKYGHTCLSSAWPTPYNVTIQLPCLLSIGSQL